HRARGVRAVLLGVEGFHVLPGLRVPELENLPPERLMFAVDSRVEMAEDDAAPVNRGIRAHQLVESHLGELIRKVVVRPRPLYRATAPIRLVPDPAIGVDL